jgi:hypothetical protein
VRVVAAWVFAERVLELVEVLTTTVFAVPLEWAFAVCFTQWLVSLVAVVSAATARTDTTPTTVAIRQIRLTVFQ